MRDPSPTRGSWTVGLALGLALLLPACGRAEEGGPQPTVRTLLAERGAILLSDLPSGEAAARADLATAFDVDAPPEPGAPLTIDYPLEGSVFPPDMVAPTFLWHDDAAANAWLITVHLQDGGTIRVLSGGPPPPEREVDPAALGPTNEIYEPTPYQASARSWTPSPETWAAMKAGSVESAARVTIAGLDVAEPRRWLSAGTVTLATSKDPVGAPIFYRDVPLMPVEGKSGVIQPLSTNNLPLIAWRLRDVSRPESRLVLTGMPTCANCHSFSLDGRTMGMDVDGPQGDKGAYMIAPVEPHMVVTQEEVITWNAFADKPDDHRTIGFLSRISPTGRYAVTTLNEALYTRNFTDYRFLQVFFPTRGILAWTSKATGEMLALPGADDTAYVHCDPAWFPDEKQIVFARAEAFDPHPPGQEPAEYANDPKEPQIRYDLYRMPFDEGRGGEPVRIEGASENGMSNTFPKVSPDGRWIVYTKCRNGQLMRPDSRLWIVPAEGGEAREMRCNTSRMNSWHSFSPNGRWMVFSSKANTPYTEMFLTHIDEEGNDTPAILIPDSTAANRAVNLPEFLNAKYEALIDITMPAVNHHRYFMEARALLREERFAEAAAALEQAVASDPDFLRAHVNLGYCLSRLGETERAREHYLRALALDGDDPFALVGLGRLAEEEGRHEEALRQFRQAVAADPSLPVARRHLGLASARLGRLDDALVHLRQVLARQPRDLEVNKALVVLLSQRGRMDQALPHLEAVVALDPADVQARTLWAWTLATSPRAELRDGERAVRQAEEACRRTQHRRPEPYDTLAAALAECGRFEEAVQASERALALGPNPTLRAEIEKRRDLYRQGRPYRQHER